MKRILIVMTLATLGLLAAPAEAGGRHYGDRHGYHHGPYAGHRHGAWRGHYGPPRYRYGYGHRYRHGHGYRHHHRHHDVSYLTGGLILGALVNEAFRPRTVVTERVVYRRPVEIVSSPRPAPSARGIPAPVERPPVYLRRDADGSCWLIEQAEDGSEIISPQDPDVCG